MTQSPNDPTALLAKAGQTAKKLAEGGAAAMTSSSHASTAAFQELAKAYQEMATRNAQTLTSAIQSLSAIKNPAEFVELQQNLMKEGVQAAVADSQKIATLTVAVFTAAFEPVKKQIEEMQKTTLR